MAQFDESKIINALHTDKAEIGKKYWVADELLDLKEVVEKEQMCFELKDIREGYLYPFIGEFINSTSETEFQFIYPFEEPKYRPYVDTEEMINDFCERSGAKRSKMGEPFIWVKDGDCKLLILSIEKDCVWTVNCRWSMEELLDTFTYCDGTPIGKKE